MNRMLINKRKKSPMYDTKEEGKQAKKNHWYVREIGSDQPTEQSWRAWWESRLLGKAHIKWRSTCIAMNCPNPFKPPYSFEVEFLAPNGKIYELEFKLAPFGPNK